MSPTVHPKTSQFGVVIAVEKEQLVLLSTTVSRDEAAKLIRQHKNHRTYASFFPVSEGEAKQVIAVMNQSRAIRSLLS
jgi:hypothetical protein